MENVTEFKNLLFKSDKKALMSALDAEESVVNKFVLGVVNTIALKPDLLKCTPESLRNVVMTSATLGLPIDAREYAYIVPYKGRAQLQVSYKGYVHIAKRDPDVDNIQAIIVYPDDKFSVDLGLNTVSHIPDLHSKSYGREYEMTHVYAIVRFKQNTGRAPMFEVMTKAQVDEIRGMSKAGGEKDKFGNETIWQKHYGS